MAADWAIYVGGAGLLIGPALLIILACCAVAGRADRELDRWAEQRRAREDAEREQLHALEARGTRV